LPDVPTLSTNSQHFLVAYAMLAKEKIVFQICYY